MSRLYYLFKALQVFADAFGFDLHDFGSFLKNCFDQIRLCHLSNCHIPKNSHEFQNCLKFLWFSIFLSAEGFIFFEGISLNSQLTKCNFICFSKSNVEEIECFGSFLMLQL